MTESSSPTPCPRCGALLEAPGACPSCLLRAAHASGAPVGSGGAGFEAPSVESIDAALPSYDVQVLIGRGGMGAVYRARHRKLDRPVAIKVLRPAADSDAAEAAAFAERFEREARVLARLDHPHIVRIYDFGQTEGPDPLFYLVLEYVEGASLRELLHDERLTARDVLEFVPQICDALQTAHALGVVHRDIKPENILVDGSGRVRIADFGLAKLRDGEATAFGLTQSHQVFGTPHYMAPEQMRATGAVDHRADLYSLGVVLYEMLTGELPLGRFAAPSAKASDAKPLDDVVFKALESEPDERYQAAAELRRDVEESTSPAAEPTPTIDSDAVAAARSRSARSTGERSVSTEPGSSYAVRRTWAAVGVATLTFSMPWARVYNLYGSTRDVEFSGQQLSGFEGGMTSGILDIQFWYAYVALVGAAVLRTLRQRGRPISETWPVLLTVAGLYLVYYVLAAFGAGEVEGRGGILLSLLVFVVSVLLDAHGYLRRSVEKQRANAASVARYKRRRRRRA